MWPMDGHMGGMGLWWLLGLALVVLVIWAIARMMQMHQGTMGHMMEHMQAGPKSMAMCPMMKM